VVLELYLLLPWRVFKDGTTRSDFWQGVCISLAEVEKETSRYIHRLQEWNRRDVAKLDELEKRVMISK